jgi:hypothetical protein
MIQRIQSIWFLLAAICALLTIQFPFYSGNKVDVVTGVKAFQLLNAQSNLPILMVTMAIAVAALIVIFLFKDRKRQLMIGVAILVSSLINISLYVFKTQSYVVNEGKYALSSVITFIIPIFLLLAVRGIWKDEQLVKSVDRLR